MPTKISANLERLTSQAQLNDRVNVASNQGFKSQERTIYIYEMRNFYGKNRAVFNELDNQIFILRPVNEQKKTVYILEEDKDNSDFGITANVIGNNLYYSMRMDTLLDTENRTYFFTFKPIEEGKEDLKMENVFFSTNIVNKNTGNPNVDYEYNLVSIGTILGKNSVIKIFPEKVIPKIDKIYKITVTPKEKWLFGGFDSNLDFEIRGVLPVWTKILKSEGGSIDYVNLWANSNWIVPWNDLYALCDRSAVTGKLKTTIRKLLTFNGKVFEPGYNLIKKLLSINISLIRDFEGFNRTKTINTIGQIPGIYWQEKLNNLDTQGVAKVLNGYIMNEMRQWKTNTYRGPIKTNYPFGEPLPFPDDSLKYSEIAKERTLQVIFMLSTQIISPLNFMGGRNDFAYFTAPYFLQIDEISSVITDREIGMYIINPEKGRDEVDVKSGYIFFSYPAFTERQIKEYNETGTVTDYDIEAHENSVNPEETYGPINPYILVGESPIIYENHGIEITAYKLLAENYSRFDFDSFGFDNTPLIAYQTNYREGDWVKRNVGDSNFVPFLLMYSYSTIKGWETNERIHYKKTKLTQITFDDFVANPNTVIGIIEDGGPNPKADQYQSFINMDDGYPQAVSHVVAPPARIYNKVQELVDKVNDDSGTYFIGEPIVEIKVDGYFGQASAGFRFFDYWVSGYKIIATTASENKDLLGKVAKRKGISIGELTKQITDSNKIQLRNFKLTNEGVFFSLIDQEIILPFLKESISVGQYPSYPAGVTAEDISDTWVFLNVEASEFTDILQEVSTKRKFNNDLLVNIPYVFNNVTKANHSQKLEYFKIRGVFAGIGEVKILYGNNQTITFNIVLGDTTDESVAVKNLVFKVREAEI